MAVESHRFQAEVSQVLRLVIGSLYSNPEIFLRELLSNASDALDRRRFRALQAPEVLPEGTALEVRLVPDATAGTLTIADSGVGMTAEELVQHLGTIAHSGTRAFLEQIAQRGASDAPALIGQFGVGFYSAYLVADRVDVISRAAGSSDAHRWSSDAGEGFTLEPAERAEAGTSVVLHLKPEHRSLLEAHRLRALVQKYSDYLGHPVRLRVTSGEGAEATSEDEVLNRGTALWRRAPREVERAQYVEFYQHLCHDWQEPLGWKHFKIEGTQEFAGVLFVPGHALGDLWDAEEKHGVRLHVRRVMVMEACEELLPRWLRFVRGVVDSEDLPLNVSREILQDSRAVRVIKKQVVSQALDLLHDLAGERADDYVKFWRAFGAVLKEGLHFDPEYKERLAPLLRFETARHTELTSLAAYVAAMPEAQPAIYYAAGTARRALEHAPQLEALSARGWDVLLLTDAVDPFAVAALGEFEGKALVDVASTAFELPTDDAATRDAKAAAAKPLIDRMERVLAERVARVRASSRLAGSPACLVTPEGGLAPHVERALRARHGDLPLTRRTLEIDLDHPLVKALERVDQAEPGSERVASWIDLLYQQALLAEGTPLDDPARVARQMAELLAEAVQRAAGPAAG